MLTTLIWWIFLPGVVFWSSFQIGIHRSRKTKDCIPNTIPKTKASSTSFDKENVVFHDASILKPNHDYSLQEAENFHQYRFQYMGKISMESNTLVEMDQSKSSSSSNINNDNSCTKYVNAFAWVPRYGSSSSTSCVAIVKSTNLVHTQPIVRQKPPNPNMKDPGGDGHGFFTKVSIDRSRLKTAKKFMPFALNFDSIEKYIKERLNSRYNHDNNKDLVVMVVNAGELDLFLNFACSTALHNIDISNVVVFCGSEDIIPVVEKTGALGLYHSGFFSVSRQTSHDYLDFTFVDMMWYKCFSIYLILREGYNILFQDVDLIWLRNPFEYFQEILAKENQSAITRGLNPLDALLSDDAQRSLRYTPFFANSGFYYLRSNLRTRYFAWSVMTSFPMIQRLGSHQNMFVQRLLETTNIFGLRTFLLSLEEFPNGYLYHHNRAYMKRLEIGEVHPYFFHMCWTQGKVDKLKYMKKEGMWYLNETVKHTKEAGPGGWDVKTIENALTHANKGEWKTFAKGFCVTKSNSL